MRDPAATTSPPYPDPEIEPDSDPTPTEPDAPDTPRAPSPPEEMPFLEPKHYPIHPDIPVQPIHEQPRGSARS
jgi:hypothetical protein